jgi:nifR3 family TIM-barrel protein
MTAAAMDIFSSLGLKSPYVILAPMAGVSSSPFRMINRKFGCGFAFTEMVCSRSLSSLNKKTFEMLRTLPGDHPFGVQILGRDVSYILKSLDILQDYDFQVLDLNAACPMKKVVNCGKGASLLKEPKLLGRILKEMVTRSKWPVTVKIRTGWDNHEDGPEAARYARDAGVRAIIVHGRTRNQLYRGKPDYDAIRKIKNSVDIPVIASGDILSGALAKKMLDETGCDGVAVARGALGNPWIFRDIASVLSAGVSAPRPSMDELVATIKEHLELTVSWYGEKRGIKMFHKFFIWYTHGLPRVKPLRAKVEKTMTEKALCGLVDELSAMRPHAESIKKGELYG